MTKIHHKITKTHYMNVRDNKKTGDILSNERIHPSSSLRHGQSNQSRFIDRSLWVY